MVYLGQTFWPDGLAVLYPYQPAPSLGLAVAAGALLLGVSAAVIFVWRTRPYLATGWFWYLGMLVPVIGLVQVGRQSHADRYMYLPMVGLLLMLAWGAADVLAKWPQAKMGIVVAAGLSLCGMPGGRARADRVLAEQRDTFPARHRRDPKQLHCRIQSRQLPDEYQPGPRRTRSPGSGGAH